MMVSMITLCYDTENFPWYDYRKIQYHGFIIILLFYNIIIILPNPMLIHEDQQEAKAAEIRALKVELIRLQLSHEWVSRNLTMTVHNPIVVINESDITVARRLHETAERIHNSRVGKAPPIHTFTGENVMSYGRIGCQLLSGLLIGMVRVRTKSCCSWLDISEKALREWNLLSGTQTSSFSLVTEEMQNRLDLGSKALAV